MNVYLVCLRLLYQSDDLCEGGVLANVRRLHNHSALLVDRTANDDAPCKRTDNRTHFIEWQ